jgi:hypothetical protein
MNLAYLFEKYSTTVEMTTFGQEMPGRLHAETLITDSASRWSLRRSVA